MSLSTGTRLGPYEITAHLGEGGMGQVYKAKDTRLDRLVAIKQSASEFSDRFEREARAVAALNHPNICQLFDVGPDYLVMEFLDGRPLAPVEGTRKLLDLAVQIADGMAAAHASGVVHRDLKPDNIFVTADGRVKILDFGIAKAIGDEAGDQHTRASLTGAGTAIGTVHYMSPEQARGLATIGAQSDQFSFGLILYELATGEKAFARDSGAETLTAIIREDAAPLPPSVPAPLRWIIERLLAKDPSERYDSSRDLYRELKQLRDRLADATAPVSGVTAAVSAAPVPASRTRSWLPLVAAVAVAVAVTAGLAWTLWPRSTGGAVDLSTYRFTPLSLEATSELEPAWSPDGRSLAYTAAVDGVPQLMVREVGGTAVQLTRTAFPVAAPFWAPDGSRVYFVSGAGPALFSVSAVGGEPEQVIAGATSAAIHPRDGRFVFARAGSLWLVDPSSGEAPEPFGQAPFTDPSSSPGAMPVHVEEFSPDGTRIAVLKAASLWLLAYPGGEARRLSDADLLTSGFSSWMPDSRHYTIARTLDRTLVGSAIVIVDSETQNSRAIFTSPEVILQSSVSRDGTRLAFVSGELREKLVEVQIADGRVRALDTGSHLSRFPSLSPDGTRLAFSGVAGDVTGTIREMTLSATGEVVSKTITVVDGGQMVEHVQWSPDGARILFSALGPTGSGVMMVPAAGGRALRVDPDAPMSRGGVWSPDGTHIVYRRQVGDDHQLVTARVGTSAPPTVLKRWTAKDPLRLPLAWSPDGRWILTRQGPSFSLMAADGSNERPLFLAGGAQEFSRPVFSRDGREVLLLRRDTSAPGRPWRLFATDVSSGTQRVVMTADFPTSVDSVSGLSLSLDGTRLYTSMSERPFDLWMLEGFR